MALRTRYMENGGGYDRYAYPYQTTVKPLPYVPTKSVGYIDPSQINGGTVFRAQICPPECPADWPIGKEPPAVIVETKNGNGEKIQAALDVNGEVIATKKAPPNIVPIALAAAAAWFFLM